MTRAPHKSLLSEMKSEAVLHTNRMNLSLALYYWLWALKSQFLQGWAKYLSNPQFHLLRTLSLSSSRSIRSSLELLRRSRTCPAVHSPPRSWWSRTPPRRRPSGRATVLHCPLRKSLSDRRGNQRKTCSLWCNSSCTRSYSRSLVQWAPDKD